MITCMTIQVTITVTILIAFQLLILDRKTSYIAINFDNLVDMTEIIKRGKIFVSNRDNVTLEDYIVAHINEQKIVPEKILKIKKLQELGYKLIFFSARREYLRAETAQVLNTWELVGDLYMDDLFQKNVTFYRNILKFLKRNYKVVGLVGNDTLLYNDINLPLF